MTEIGSVSYWHLYTSTCLTLLKGFGFVQVFFEPISMEILPEKRMSTNKMTVLPWDVALPHAS